jgi:starch phosphorylase
LKGTSDFMVMNVVSSLAPHEHTVSFFREDLLHSLYHLLGTTPHSASSNDIYRALSYTVRDYLSDRYRETSEAYYDANPRFVYYLSAEFHLGKQLANNMLYTDTDDLAKRVFEDAGLDLDAAIETDPEPGLANGGLGRLAACFLDSLATLGIPAIGYGIRYEYGIFRQEFENGWQAEQPDEWLTYGYPWEFVQSDDMVEVGFNGTTEVYRDQKGRERVRWLPSETVRAEPYHILVPGYGTRHANILRLWRARAREAFNFQLFDSGDYARAVSEQIESEIISKVLYPNDNNPRGKELRLQQQYFFVAASLRDIIGRFRLRNEAWTAFPEKVVIQLNDTHPVIAIPELMRILLDEEGLDWDVAWDITRRTFAYTCHSLLPEVLERWHVGLFEHLLPRHLQIIYEINAWFLDEVRGRFPGDEGRIERMSIIEEHPVRQVRMANLATVGSFAVNGVAELHSRLLRELVLPDFYEMYPERFTNVTNGVTPRRFMLLANPDLSALITRRIGASWPNDLERLRELEPHLEDPAFRQQWRAVKRDNKSRLAAYIREHTGVEVDSESIFDVLVKRIHEYKRQHLKVLHIITLYNRLKADPDMEMTPRTFIFGGKSAPGYGFAKLIIKLVNSVADVINNDPDVRGRLKVVFLPNFNVSLGEVVYPAADISEQISTAGKEASGTGNMKFALNGAVTVGTLDGANVEIRDLVGPENFYLFGLTADAVLAARAAGYNPRRFYDEDDELRQAIDAIASGAFSPDQPGLFQPLVESLLGDDQYLLLADYRDYVDTSERAARDYADIDRWTRMSILNCARCGFFSSDRSIRNYAERIWKVEPVPVPGS